MEVGGSSDGVGRVEVADAAEGVDVGRRTRAQRVLLPLDEMNGWRTWHAVGPVRYPVDPLKFNFDAHLVAHRRWACREVFARAVFMLVERKRFSSAADAFASLQLLARSLPLEDDDGAEQPSWDGFLGLGRDLTPTECDRVLARGKQAVTKAKKAKGRRRAEHVTITALGDGRSHFWYRYGVELDRKRRAIQTTIKAARAVAFLALPLKRQRQVVALAGASYFKDVRRKIELVTPPTPSSDDEDSDEKMQRKRRRRRRKMPWGTTAPKLLPTPEQVRDVIRGAVDEPGATPHSFLTLDANGGVRVWRYVIGSASTGTRWYAMSNGTRKRLAAPYHRRPLQPVDAAPGDDSMGRSSAWQRPVDPVVAVGGPSNAACADGSLLVGVRLGASGIASADPRPTPVIATPEVAVNPAVGTATNLDADDAAAASSAAAEVIARFHITRSTYLEDAPRGTSVRRGSTSACRGGRGGGRAGREVTRGRELVIAVEFDAVFALRRAFREDSKPSVLHDVQSSAPVLTLAGDGGPVLWTSMTVFTVTACSPLLRKGRTAFIPIMYILGGEQVVHSAVGDRLYEVLKVVLNTEYAVPLQPRPSADAAPSLVTGGAQSSPEALAASAIHDGQSLLTPLLPSRTTTAATTAASATSTTIIATTAPSAFAITATTPSAAAGTTATGSAGMCWSTSAVRSRCLVTTSCDGNIVT